MIICGSHLAPRWMPCQTPAAFLPMSRSRLIIFLLSGLFVVTWGRAAALEITPASVDFGRMTQNTSAQKTVMVRNTTTRAVRILQAQADCGCTIPKLATPLLAPGQTTPLTVLFESRNYLGPVTRRVQLVTDAGIETIEVHANVTPYADWVIEPALLVMPPSLVEQIAQSELLVRYTGDAPNAALTAVATDQPWLQAKLLPGAEPNLWRIQLTKVPKAPPGSHAAVARLATNDHQVPELKVNLVIPVASSLRVAPDPVIFPRGRVGAETRVSFRLIGWKHEALPQVSVAGATVAYLGSVNGEYTFELILKAEKAGAAVLPVKVMLGEQLQLELKALATIDP